MRSLALSALSLGSILLFATACSSSSSSGGTGGGTSTGGGSCPANLAQAAGDAFCQSAPSTVDCALVTGADHTQVCGVPVPSPTTELARSSTVMEFAGSGPPDLSCYQPANYPKAGTSQMVTMSGLARIFSHGCQSNQLTIEVHTVVRTGGADDGDVGPIVGSAVMTAADCTATGTQTMNSDCGTRYECPYTYPGVPSETELVILTNGAMWAPLYEYNDYIPTAEVMNGTWSHDVRALASDDYSAIPEVAIGATIPSGQGALAGEVHDCGNVRLTNATVDTNVAREALTYFDSDEQSPLPLSSQTSTSDLGLYAAFDLKPGPIGVAALGLVGGKLTTVGYYKAFIHPNAVTAVTFQGLRPFQIGQ